MSASHFSAMCKFSVAVVSLHVGGDARKASIAAVRIRVANRFPENKALLTVSLDMLPQVILHTYLIQICMFKREIWH